MRKPATALLLLFLLACGASARERTVATALTTTNAARDSFVAFDAAYQQKIVATATSLEDGRAKLDAYRAKRDPLIQAFATVYRLVATAALSTDGVSVADMLHAIKLLQAALKELGV